MPSLIVGFAVHVLLVGLVTGLDLQRKGKTSVLVNLTVPDFEMRQDDMQVISLQQSHGSWY